MKRLSLIITIVLLGCSAHSELGISNLTVDAYASKIQKKAVLIDVRTLEEYRGGHIAKAENVDYFDQNFISNISAYNKRKPIYIYCRSGKRSGKAAKIMDSLGFKYILNLKGGISAWKEANMPIVKN